MNELFIIFGSIIVYPNKNSDPEKDESNSNVVGTHSPGFLKSYDGA